MSSLRLMPWSAASLSSLALVSGVTVRVRLSRLTPLIALRPAPGLAPPLPALRGFFSVVSISYACLLLFYSQKFSF